MSEIKFRKFAQLVKVDEASREIGVVVTAEVPDKEGEVCDYDTTKPYYKAWSDELAKATDGKNLGNLREMHTLKAAGAGKTIEFRDDEKAIFMTFKVVDDDAWKKVQEGVYTGVSQGGSYVKQWKQDGLTYYTANPSEVSLVDNPCLQAAHFQYVKADGTAEVRKFVTPRQRQEEAKAKFDQELAQMKSLNKSMWDVSRLAELVQGIACVRDNAQWEKSAEGDDSQLPDLLTGCLEELITAFKAMVEEETTELTAPNEGSGVLAMSEQTKDLSKAARKSLSDHMCKAKEMCMALHDHMDKMHKLLGADENPGDVKEENIESEAGVHEGGEKAAKAALVSFTKEELEAHDAQLIEKATTSAAESVIAAIFGDDQPEAAAKGATPGIGNRSAVVAKTNQPVVRPVPVAKEQDNGAPAVQKTLSAAEQKELVIKAMNGDAEAAAELFKSVKPEAPRASTSVMMAKSKQ